MIPTLKILNSTLIEKYFHRKNLRGDNHPGIVAAENCLNPVLPFPHIPAEGQKMGRVPVLQSCSVGMWPSISTAPVESQTHEVLTPCSEEGSVPLRKRWLHYNKTL